MKIPTQTARRIAAAGLLCLLAPLAAGTALANEHAAPRLEYLDDLPPLIDRQKFFGDPEISNSQVSPNGEYTTFTRPYKGVMNIWIKGIDESFDDARPLTADERPVPGYFWTEDSKYVLYVQDKGGNENYHVYAVDPTAETQEDTGVPPARDLTPLEGVRARIYAVPESTPGQIIVGLNDRDPALHDVYRVDIASGERELIIENDENIAGYTTDLDGNIRLATRQTGDGGTEIMRVVDGKLGETVYTCSWKETCGAMRFHTDSQRVYLQTNKGDDVDLVRLMLMDAETGETELVESDPEGEVDFGGAIFSDETEELIGTVYVGDRQRVYPRTRKLEAALEFLRSELPDGEISFSPQTNDDRLVKVVVSRDVDPGTVYIYDWKENSVEKQYETRPDLPTEHLASMKAIRFEARDGLSIPAYVTTPTAGGGKDLPLVLDVHGGPWARDTWGYNPMHQFLANRGYAVLSVNFRGSTGYGKAFLNAGNKEWGESMQDDLTDGVKHLVDQGVADPEQVCIMGGSYGGYATLAGLTFTPEVYKCGVDIVGPSNLITLLNSIPPYWGPIRKIFTQRMGDPSTEEGRKQLEAQSPLNHVENIEDPLLVIQGANDPRVKQAESDQIVVAMREKDLPVEYIVAPDEGHGFRGRENRLAMIARIEEFLARQLGGRYQEGMAPEVEKRLDEITVDVSSVEKPRPASDLDAAKTTPLPQVDSGMIRKGRLDYRSSLTVRGQEMEVTTTREFMRDDSGDEPKLVVKSSSQGPMGQSEDEFVLEADSLRPIKREATQGQATVTVEFRPERIKGSIEAGPQEIPINIGLDAPVFGGETGLDAVLTALPLEAGYRDTLRTVEVGMQQRVRYFRVEVTGRETVEVPAGEFEAWKIRLTAIDDEGGDQTVWVTTETPRMLVKSTGKLPAQMGGGDVSTVLVAAE